MPKLINSMPLVAIAALTAVAMIPVNDASAQSYPSKRINLIVGFSAGGFTGTASRIVGDHISKKLGQTVVVTARPGAASNIAALAVSKAKPDGYTILASTTSLTVNTTLYKSLEYNLLNDLTPVAIAVRAPETFSVYPGTATSMKDFLQKSKSNKFTYGSAGIGSGSYLTWFSFFKNVAKANIKHVPFKGGAPAMQAVIGGQVQGFAATSSGNVVAQIKAGKIHCLAIAAAKRESRAPNCPTLAEIGYPGIEASSWVGFWVPKGTPADVIAKLNAAVNSIVENKEAAAKLTRSGKIPGLGVKETDAFVRNEVETWAARVKASGAEVK